MLLLFSGITSAQNSALPKPGVPAPALHFDRVLQAPPKAEATLTSLRGKVVVLEFWATWCAPCVAEIPVLNKLRAETDPNKVVFVAIDDQDAATVQSFLKTHPMAGWIGLDTQGMVFRTDGVEARPATIVIGPDGRIVSSTLSPEQLNAKQLTALADGRRASLHATVDPATAAQVRATTRALMEQQGMSNKVDSVSSATGVSVSVADLPAGTTDPDVHIFPQGPADIDITNAPLKLLFTYGAGIPSDRLRLEGTFPAKYYNLHVHLGQASSHDRMEAVLIAIRSATGVSIDRKTNMEDVLLLQPLPSGTVRLKTSATPGMAGYDPKGATLQCFNASMDDTATAIGSALKIPVLDDTGLPGKLTLTSTVPPGDIAAMRSTLESEAGLTLTKAQRPIERFTITPPAK